MSITRFVMEKRAGGLVLQEVFSFEAPAGEKVVLVVKNENGVTIRTSMPMPEYHFVDPNNGFSEGVEARRLTEDDRFFLSDILNMEGAIEVNNGSRFVSWELRGILAEIVCVESYEGSAAHGKFIVIHRARVVEAPVGYHGAVSPVVVVEKILLDNATHRIGEARAFIIEPTFGIPNEMRFE